MALFIPDVIVASLSGMSTSSDALSSETESPKIKYAIKLYPNGKLHDVEIEPLKARIITSPITTLSHSNVTFITPSGISVNSPIIPPLNSIIDNDIFVPSFRYTSRRDVCDNENIRRTVIKIIYHKLIEKWLYDEYTAKHIHKYLKIVDGKARLIGKNDKISETTQDDSSMVEKKNAYIRHHIISRDDIVKIIRKFTKETGVSWCDVVKSKYSIRETILRSIKKKMKRLIKNI